MTAKEFIRELSQERYDRKNLPVVFVDVDGNQHGIVSIELVNGSVRLYEQGAEEEPDHEEEGQ